jgi:hypothetical protein
MFQQASAPSIISSNQPSLKVSCQTRFSNQQDVTELENENIVLVSCTRETNHRSAPISAFGRLVQSSSDLSNLFIWTDIRNPNLDTLDRFQAI